MAVYIKMMDGRFLGETREVTGAGLDPNQFFTNISLHGWRWEVNYKHASQIEIYEWFLADLVARIIRALKENRPVYFLEKIYRLDNSSLVEITQKIEDDIVSSGTIIAIGTDDENGFVIKADGCEKQL